MYCGTCPAGAPRDTTTGVVFRSVCSDAGWCWQNPLPHGNRFYAAFAPTNDEVWAVGEMGIIQHWTDAGWDFSYSPANRTLMGISGNSADNVWVVGSAGTVLRWDGSKWGADSPASNSLLTAVAVSAAGTVGVTSGSTVYFRRGPLDWTSGDYGSGVNFDIIAAISKSDFAVVSDGDGGVGTGPGSVLVRFSVSDAGFVSFGVPHTSARKILNLLGSDGGSVVAATRDGTILEFSADGGEIPLTGLSSGTLVAAARSRTGEVWVATTAGEIFTNAGVAGGGLALVSIASQVKRTLKAIAAHRSDSAMLFGDLGQAVEAKQPTMANVNSRLRYWSDNQTESNLYGITGWADGNVKAVGAIGTVVGCTYSRQRCAVEISSTLALYQGISGVSANDYWVVSPLSPARHFVAGVPTNVASPAGVRLTSVAGGETGSPVFAGYWTATDKAALAAVDGGVLKVLPDVAPTAPKGLESICMTPNRDWFWAFGHQGSGAQVYAGSVPSGPVFNWTVTTSASLVGAACEMVTGTLIAQDRMAWVVGTPAIIVRTMNINGNQSENVEYNPGQGSLSAIANGNGVGMWAVGNFSAPSVMRRVLPASRFDSGWVDESIPTTKMLRGVWVSTDGGGVWAVGDEGTIIRKY